MIIKNKIMTGDDITLVYEISLFLILILVMKWHRDLEVEING